MSEQINHMNGFEKEETIEKMHSNPAVAELLYQRKDFMTVARIINPALCEGAFERKECRRKLRYIGTEDKFCVYGNIYNSIDFNGATYSIEGRDDFIGRAFFEYLDDIW